MTYVVLAPEHPLVDELTTPEHRAAVKAYQEQARRQPRSSAMSTEREKTGVLDRLATRSIPPTVSACRSGSPTTCW